MVDVSQNSKSGAVSQLSSLLASIIPNWSKSEGSTPTNDEFLSLVKKGAPVAQSVSKALDGSSESVSSTRLYGESKASSKGANTANLQPISASNQKINRLVDKGPSTTCKTTQSTASSAVSSSSTGSSATASAPPVEVTQASSVTNTPTQQSSPSSQSGTSTSTDTSSLTDPTSLFLAGTNLAALLQFLRQLESVLAATSTSGMSQSTGQIPSNNIFAQSETTNLTQANLLALSKGGPDTQNSQSFLNALSALEKMFSTNSGNLPSSASVNGGGTPLAELQSVIQTISQLISQQTKGLASLYPSGILQNQIVSLDPKAANKPLTLLSSQTEQSAKLVNISSPLQQTQNFIQSSDPFQSFRVGQGTTLSTEEQFLSLSHPAQSLPGSSTDQSGHGGDIFTSLGSLGFERIVTTTSSASPPAVLGPDGSTMTAGNSQISINSLPSELPVSQSNSSSPLASNAFLKSTLSNMGQPSAVEQVLVQLNRSVKLGQSQLSIQLQPTDLGKINVKLDVGADGKVQGRVTADSPITLNLLVKDQKTLERALSDAGLQVDTGSLQFNLSQQHNASTNSNSTLSSSTNENTLSTVNDGASGSAALIHDDSEVYYILPNRVNMKV